MIDPYKGISEEVKERHKEAAYERYRIELIKSIEQLLSDFEMTWDDLSNMLKLKRNGQQLKRYIGINELKDIELNAIAHVFSTDLYIIFRPRAPWIGS